MKTLWVSNAPWTPSGYGQQTAQVTRRLRDAGHEVGILAFYGLEGAMMAWDGMPVYPTDYTRLGKHMLKPYAEHFGGGSSDGVQVIMLQDAWTLVDGRWGGMLKADGLRIANWVPIDHDPLPPQVAMALSTIKSRPIAMSRFGEEQLQLAGFDPLYAPHAIETDVFRPMDDRAEFRAAMKIPADAFVVGMVANNMGSAPPRKAFPQVFQAFAEFKRRHSDAFLHLHCDVMGINDGINLLALSEICGIPGDSIGATDQLKIHLGVDAEIMARIFSSFDVLANPSYGEGFGIPIIEAQSCGTPVIVTDWTAMPELVGAGWKVLGDRWYDPAHGSFFMCPSVMEILDAFEEAYDKAESMRDQAREFALGYDADKVFAEHWLPIIELLEERPEERLNRAARRAKAKAAA